MTWYAAHCIMFVEYKQGPQDAYPLWENILLIQAGTEEEAFTKAETRAREDEGDDDGSFRWEGTPARWVFAGVRKLTVCGSGGRPGNGTEVTYLEMQASTKETVRKYLAGEPVSMRIAEVFPESIQACD